MGVRDWSTVADDNGDSDPTINWTEGQMPSTVNDSARSMMAALAAYFADSGGKLISAGSSNAYTLTTNMGVAALGSPLTLMFEADRNNTGAATLAVDGLTAKPMKSTTGAALASGDIVDGGVYFAVYNVTADAFFLLNVKAAADLSTYATITYVDNLVAGLDIKPSAKAATTANITLSAAQTIDGISCIAGDRVLVKDQSAPAQNGLYVVATGSWTRATDMDAWSEVPGANVWVEQGTTNADRAFVCTADTGGTLGTTAITWQLFGGTGAFQAYSALLTSLAGLSIVAGDVIYGSGSNVFSRLAKGTDGQLLSLVSGLPAWVAAPSTGKIGQVLQTQYTTNASLTVAIPFDDTIPTNTEGTQVLSQAITPASSSSTIRVSGAIGGAPQTLAARMTVSVFRGSTCIETKFVSSPANNAGVALAFDVVDSPATGSSVTYTVRVGTDTGNLGLNGSSSARFFGGVSKCTLTLEELL